jgi:hypothetical protein
MMSLDADLRHLIEEYLAGVVSLDGLVAWLAEHVQETFEDGALRDLSDRLWILVSELDRNDRDEESLRRELAALAIAA